ncbi:MAG: HEAT repeat domain-containing protein, partial [Phycisphaerae bacterium]|nr:HEAT repeat domain-containing protein [Phycisphaerae bacterium]
LQRFLMDGDTATRNAFFNMAPHYGPLNKRSQRVLAKLMLEIPDDKIRARAAQAIGVSGGGIEVIDELKRAMKNDTSVDVRAAALSALNASRAKDKIAINIEATKDVAATIRRRATEALKWGSIPPEKRKAAILALRGLVEDEDIAVRQYTLVGLGRHRALEAFPDVMRALDDKEGKIQMSAMSAISHFTSSMELDKDSIDMVLEFASKDKMNAKGRAVGKGHWLHGGGVVTRWTAMSIATLYAPRDKAINMLISQLKQPELRTRGRALGHLVQLRAAEAAPHIGKLLAHPSLGLRGHAAWALGRLGQRQYIPAIIALMNDEDILSGKGIQPNSWARGTKPQPMPYGGYSGPEPGSPRPAIIKSLGNLGATEAIPDLITLMETHSHPMTRLAAAGVLRRWARLDKRIVPALGRITEDVHPKSQLLVIRWLVEIGDKRAIPYLEKLLTGEYKKPTETSPFAVEAMEDKTVWA